MEKMRFSISSSPHIRQSQTVQSIMRDVVIALIPTAIYGVIQFGYQAVSYTHLLIRNGVINEKELKKLSLSVEELMEALRAKDASVSYTHLPHCFVSRHALCDKPSKAPCRNGAD